MNESQYLEELKLNFDNLKEKNILNLKDYNNFIMFYNYVKNLENIVLKYGKKK